MASPQRENGFTGIAHEILLAVSARKFGATQQAVLMLLWRETYGWNRIEAPFSLGLIQRHTGIDKPYASRLLATLQRLKVIEMTTPPNEFSPATYRFQKDYEKWEIGLRGGLCPDTTGGCVPDNGGGCVPDNPSKKGIKKSSSEGLCPDTTPPPPEQIPDLGARVVRQLTQLQPSGLSQEDRKRVAELLRNTDKSHQRILEAVADAVRDTQITRRERSIQAPVRFALSVVGRMLSEPEPIDTKPEFVKAPAGWRPPGSREETRE